MRLGQLIAVLLLATTLHTQAQPPETPITFPADTAALDHPVEAPTSVLTAITTDKDEFPDGPPRKLRCRSHEGYPQKPAPQLLCTRLSLSRVSAATYLIVGVGSLRGAHIVPFWIVRRAARGDSVVFKAKCDALAVLTNRDKGYRELEATWITQSGASILTARYRFDGKAYVKFSSQETDH
jgi:hypothetical protein